MTAFSRSRKSLFMADASLQAPIQYQQLFVRYRMGWFIRRTSCVRDKQVWLRRGHQHCGSLPKCFELSKTERRRKKQIMQQLVLDRSMHFTNLDFVLNARRFERVGIALVAIRKALRQRYHERMLTEDSASGSEDAMFRDKIVDL